MWKQGWMLLFETFCWDHLLHDTTPTQHCVRVVKHTCTQFGAPNSIIRMYCLRVRHEVLCLLDLDITVYQSLVVKWTIELYYTCQIFLNSLCGNYCELISTAGNDFKVLLNFGVLPSNSKITTCTIQKLYTKEVAHVDNVTSISSRIIPIKDISFSLHSCYILWCSEFTGRLCCIQVGVLLENHLLWLAVKS